jgi:hypothetical protein
LKKGDCPFLQKMREPIRKTVALFRRLSPPGKLVVVHTLIILAAMALYPTEIFIPAPPFDDIYSIYFLVPGLHIMLIGMQVSHLLFPWLLTLMSHYAASILCIVFIPGVVGIILGGVQWYFIGKFIFLIKEEWQRRSS